MKRYYLYTKVHSHFLDLQVCKYDIGKNPNSNWSDYVYLDLPDSPYSDAIAERWRDDIIRCICKLRNTINPLAPLAPSNFRNYGKPLKIE